MLKYIQKYASPVGKIWMVSEEDALTALWMEGQKYGKTVSKKEYEEAENLILQETKQWLDLYFQGQDPGFFPKIQLEGSPFQKAVWNVLLTIPFGSIMTYGQIAKKIAKERKKARMSAQAVGGAVGHNPIAIIIPCHRVVGKNGNLTGYAGGIEKKRQLLILEGHDRKEFLIPKMKNKKSV